MIRTNKILYNEKYKSYLEELSNFEKDRIYCKHDLEHFLAVARIAYIKVLEANLKIEKDIIYSIGLLHDIGRVLQYKSGIPHDEGSLIIAEEILSEVEFSDSEKDIIYRCIKNHRSDSNGKLEKIIYEADKESRECFRCSAEDTCYWDIHKKNLNIKY